MPKAWYIWLLYYMETCERVSASDYGSPLPTMRYNVLWRVCFRAFRAQSHGVYDCDYEANYEREVLSHVVSQLMRSDVYDSVDARGLE